MNNLFVILCSREYYNNIESLLLKLSSWPLKQVKNFILKFSVNGSTFQVDKIIKFTTALFFLLHVEVLVRLPLIEQIMKGVNKMYISFKVKHPQTYILGRK